MHPKKAMKALPYSKYHWEESHNCFDIISVKKLQIKLTRWNTFAKLLIAFSNSQMLCHLVGLHATYGSWTRKARNRFHINQVKFTIPRKTKHWNSNAWIQCLNQIVFLSMKILWTTPTFGALTNWHIMLLWKAPGLLL